MIATNVLRPAVISGRITRRLSAERSPFRHGFNALSELESQTTYGLFTEHGQRNGLRICRFFDAPVQLVSGTLRASKACDINRWNLLGKSA